MMALEEHTGAAKTRVPSKKKEIYEERRIVVCLGGLGLMAVIEVSQSFYTPSRNFIGELHVYRKYCKNNRLLD